MRTGKKLRKSNRRRSTQTKRRNSTRRTTKMRKSVKHRRNKFVRRSRKTKMVHCASCHSTFKGVQFGGESFYADTPGIIELTTGSFAGNRVVNSETTNKPGIIMFYADWCPHCSSDETKSAWKKIGAMISKQDGWVGALNCGNANQDSELATLCNNFAVNGYPTIKFVDKTGTVESGN